MSGAVCIAAYGQMFILLRLHVDRRHSSVNTPPPTKYQTEEINFNIYRITLLTLSQPLKVVRTQTQSKDFQTILLMCAFSDHNNCS